MGDGAIQALNFLQQLGGAVGSVANASGFQGSGPGNLNALQRQALSPEQQAVYQKASALAQAGQDPNIQQMQPSEQMNHAMKLTGDPILASNFVAAMNRGKLDTGNPSQFINQSVQSGNLEVPAALTGLSNPNLQLGSLSQLNASPQGTVPAPSSFSSQLPQPQQKTGIDYDFLRQAKQLSPAAGTMAENMIAGTFTPEAGRGENDPVYNAALSIARKADPTFTPQSLVGRPWMVKNSTSGDMYKLETSLNTGMQHLYDLHELAPQTGNTKDSMPIVNEVSGKLSSNLMPGGNPGLSRYKSTLTTAAPEIAKYLGGGAATDTGTAEAKSSYDWTLPATTIQQNSRDLGSKMLAKGGALQAEYNQAMGAAATHKVVNPMTEALYADMQGVPLTLQQQQLVNNHRKEANLPPKAWGRAQTANMPVQLNIPQPQTTPSASAPQYQEGQIVRSKSDPTKFAKIVKGVPVPLAGGQ